MRRLPIFLAVLLFLLTSCSFEGMTIDEMLLGRKGLTGTVTLTDDPETRVLTASYSGNAGTNVTYQWYKDGTLIPGETTSAYAYTISDMAKAVYVKVSGDESHPGTIDSAVRTHLGGTLAIDLEIIGSDIATATYTNLPGETFIYQWYWDASPIEGADGNTYHAVADYSPHNLTAQVHGTGNYFGAITSNEVTVGCVIGGTMILMADGTSKPVEEIQLLDEIQTYSFYDGAVSTKRVVSIEETLSVTNEVLTLATTDGRTIRFVDAQAFFDPDYKLYFTINDVNYQRMEGRAILVNDGGTMKRCVISSVTSSTETVDYYELSTAEDFNFFADSFLTVSPDTIFAMLPYELDDNLRYDPEKMAEDISTYGLFTYETFPYEVSPEGFEAYGMKHYKVLLGKGILTMEFLRYAIGQHRSANDIEY